MRIETTRSAAAVRLEHVAAFHTGAADLVEQLATLAAAAREGGATLATALDADVERALTDRVPAAADAVRLARPDPAAPHGVSGQTVAARWALELRALTTGTGRPVTLLTAHTPELDGPDGRFWTELDAALNVALAGLPVRLTCVYPELPLLLEIVEGARRNHPLLLAGGQLRHNPEHLDPRAVLTERPAAPPPLLGPPDRRLAFSAWQLHEVRAAVAEALSGSGYSPERAEDVVLAVNELATNAVEHGTPEAQLSLWTDRHGLVCEIDDGGALRDPLPGLQAPHPSEPRGRGVWIARQLCDSLHVWSDERGTHVRARATR